MINLGEDFYNESNFDKGYDPVQFAFILGQIISQDDQYLMVAEKDNKIVGFISFDVVRYYTRYLVSHLFLLYVDKAHRGKAVAAKMIQKATDEAKRHGARYFYGSSTAGFRDNGRNDKALSLIYKRQNFEENGFFVRKDLSYVQN